MTDTPIHPESFASQQITGAPGQQPRKPRIAIMGEFSAGKSTLSNLLIGASSLPVKVTATQLPPVWISYGDASPSKVDLEENEAPFDFSDMSDLSIDDTKYLRVFHKSDTLELCDLIDMPGISDPNMDPAVWERVLSYSDAVIWCTHATQAWRQSEAAVWSMVDPAFYENSLLLLTRMDKIHDAIDRGRVFRRVQKETDGLFSGVYPISLTVAAAAGDDWNKWKRSGADDFATALIEVVTRIANRGQIQPAAQISRRQETEPYRESVVVLSKRKPPAPEPDGVTRVIPQRVSRLGSSPRASERPPQANAQSKPF